MNGYKPVPTPWPTRKGDSSTTYNTHHNAKEVPLSRPQAYCELRSKTLDKSDYGTQCQPTYKEDYPGWPGAKPAPNSKPDCSPLPVRPLEGNTDYSSNFTNKHSGRPEMHRPGKTVDYMIPFNACTTYGKVCTIQWHCPCTRLRKAFSSIFSRDNVIASPAAAEDVRVQ